MCLMHQMGTLECALYPDVLSLKEMIIILVRRVGILHA